MKKAYFFILLLFTINIVRSQAPYIVWQRAMGGNFDDVGNCIVSSPIIRPFKNSVIKIIARTQL